MLRDNRAGTALLIALMFPVLIGFGLLSVDMGYMYFRRILLQQTVQAASMAAANKLTTYYTSGTNASTAVVAAAQTFATANMPTGKYGTVVPAANVVLGNWNATNQTFTSLASSGGTSPNAVRVTGLNTSANGNPINLFLGGMLGQSSFNASAAAIASFSTGQTFHTIIINDLSGSFSSEIARQRTADNSILDCVRTNSGSLSRFGLTTINGHSTIKLALTQASTNLGTIQSTIAGLNACGQSGAPACSGSNVASGIYSAIQQFSGQAYTGTKKNIIIITDGVPNANSITYTTADGIYPTPGASTPTCTNNCTDANLLTMAQNQAAVARNAGISISTIYYSGSTPSNQQASYAASLGSLTGGTGVALVAPTSASITTTFAGFCATMSSAVKAVM